MTRHQILTGLLALPLVLMAWGSLREAITPLGYWVVWLLWGGAAVACLWHTPPRRTPAPAWVIASFGALVAGMVLSGVINRDAITLYQASKIIVIGGLFIVMWRLVIRTESRQLIDALYWTISIALLGFFVFRLIPSTGYTAGGIREGYILAMPGVVWKAGAFFLPVLLADLIGQPRRWIPDSLGIAACVFLVLVDRSRTGLLLMLGIVACLGILLWWRREWPLLLRRPRWMFLAAVCLMSLLLLDTGVNISTGVTAAADKGQVAAIVDDALAPVMENRLGIGDAPRIKMLRNGVAKSETCFPIGCGFGSTAIDAGFGILMDVHNAYIGALADFGLVGLLGMLGFIAASVLPVRILRNRGAPPERVYFVVGVAGSAMAYCITLMLHTFTSEMSEWGYPLIMLAFAWAPASAPWGEARRSGHHNESASSAYERRHSRWYEVMLLGPAFQLLVGLLVVALVPALLGWGWGFWNRMDAVKINTLIAVASSFVLAALTLRRLARVSVGDIVAHIIPVVTGIFLLAFAALFFSRSAYSRPTLLGAYGFAVVCCYAGYFLGKRYRNLKFAIVPLGMVHNIRSTPNIEIRPLAAPDLEAVRYDGVVADLRSESLTAEWERFLAQCILAHIPVFDVRQIFETITGRIQIDRLTENEVGGLQPSPVYSVLKRLIDIALTLVTLPITVPLMLLTALAIRLDSPGPAVFVQSRVGQGNRDFSIYKFRSMHVDAEKDGAQFAAPDDDRVTRVGRFIRHVRLDELPQLFNVLKGEMSLIGPRPEQRVFVDQFEAEIPFYIYRHVVRPGITGWAQVMQGYVADADETCVKIQHDFYYIKHFSLWLDILIVLKTVRILLTGWGAR